MKGRCREGKAGMKTKTLPKHFGRPGAAALEASRASQQDVRARQGNAEEISFTPGAILLTILTPPTSSTEPDP